MRDDDDATWHADTPESPPGATDSSHIQTPEGSHAGRWAGSHSRPPVVPPPPRRVSKWASIAPAQPFHLLARNASHRWWRPLLSLLLFVLLSVGAIVTGALLLLVFTYSSPIVLIKLQSLDVLNPFRMPLLTLFMSFALLAALIPAVVLTARWTQRRPFGSVLSVTGGMRWRWLGECLLWGTAVFGAMFAIVFGLQAIAGLPLPSSFPGWRPYLAIALIALVLAPVQSAAEEFVFRGLLLQTLTAWFRTPWIAMVVTSLAFLAGHGYTDPLVWVELTVMAMTMCWLAIRTGGLEAAIGLHVCNNTIALLVAGTAGVPTVQQAGVDYTLMQVAPHIIAILLYGWIVDRRAARRRVHTVIGGRAPIDPLTLQPRMRSRDDLQAGAAQ